MRKDENTPRTVGFATDGPHGTTLSGPIARSYYTRRRFYGDVEVWARCRGGQLGAALETWRLFLWGPNPAVGAQGYLVYVGGGLGKDTVIRRYDSTADYTVIASSGASYANGLMLRINGSAVEAWGCDFGDNELVPSNWYLRCSVNDTTYRGPYYLGIGIEDPTNGGLSFVGVGGGIPLRKQIFRHVSN